LAQDETPLVSVIIPNYNNARYIETCLDSIYDDDYSELEVIVVDDGSSDGSLEVIQRWRESHPVRFRAFQVYQQENQGTCRTLNRLVSLAKGEFIAPIAGDDYFLPGGIRARVDALCMHPDWLAIFGSCIFVDAHGALANDEISSLFEANKQALASPRFVASELILRWSVPGPSFMARRACYDPNLGIGLYNEELILVEDRDFYLRLLSRRALGFIDVPVGAYRFHQASVSRRQDVSKSVMLSLHRSESDHIADFSGLSGFWLRVMSLRGVTRLKYYDNRSLVNTALHVASSLGVRVAYLVHTIIFQLYQAMVKARLQMYHVPVVKRFAKLFGWNLVQ